MNYVVRLANLAQAEAEEYLALIHSRSNDPIAAEAWWSGLLEALRTLQTMPARCAALQSMKPDQAVRRQLIYHSHRIIFRVEEATNTVIVLRIYHGSRRPLIP